MISLLTVLSQPLVTTDQGGGTYYDTLIQPRDPVQTVVKSWPPM